MSYKLDFRFEPDYLHVQATGIRSIETIMAIAEDSIKVCEKNGCKKILIDVQRLTGELSTLEGYELGRKDFEKIKGHPWLKAAVVDLEKNRDRFHFFETVVVNSGFNIRIFSKVADAERWLRESKDNSV